MPERLRFACSNPGSIVSAASKSLLASPLPTSFHVGEVADSTDVLVVRLGQASRLGEVRAKAGNRTQRAGRSTLGDHREQDRARLGHLPVSTDKATSARWSPNRQRKKFLVRRPRTRKFRTSTNDQGYAAIEGDMPRLQLQSGFQTSS